MSQHQIHKEDKKPKKNAKVSEKEIKVCDQKKDKVNMCDIDTMIEKDIIIDKSKEDRF